MDRFSKPVTSIASQLSSLCDRRSIFLKAGWGSLAAMTAMVVMVVAGSSNGCPAQAAESHVGKSSSDSQQRVLFHLGTDNLRTNDFVTLVAFSPDGKLVAGVGANSPQPLIHLFDVLSGKLHQKIGPGSQSQATVQSIAFSRDGSKLAWGDNTGHLAIWDLSTNRLVWQDHVHSNSVSGIAISADDKRLASFCEGGSLQVRSLSHPSQPPQVLQMPPKEQQGGFGFGSLQRSITFTPDGNHLITGTATAISIWRLSDGRRIRQIERPHQQLKSIHVTSNGKRIITSGQRVVAIGLTKLKYGPKSANMSEVRVWDIESGERLKDLNGDEDHGFGYAAVSPDEKRIAIADFSLLRIIDAETGRSIREFNLPGSWGSCVEFSPDGELVAMPLSNSIGLFEVSTGRQLHDSDDSPRSPITSAAWTPDGNQLVVGSSDGRTRVWDTQTGKFVREKLLAPVISRSGWNAMPNFIGVTQDGQRIVVAGGRDEPVNYRDGIVSIYDVKTGLLVRSVEQERIRVAAVSPDRKVVAVATSHGSLGDTRLIGIDFASGETLYTVPPTDAKVGFWQLEAMTFQSNTNVLLLADGNGDVVQLDGMTGQEQRRFVADYRVVQLEAARAKRLQLWKADFSADGRFLATSSENIVSIWDVVTGMMARSIEHPHKNGCHLALSNNGKTLATVDLLYAGDYGENVIRLYDAASGQPVFTLDTQDNRAVVLRFSPDGTKLFSGNTRGSATIWDVRR